MTNCDARVMINGGTPIGGKLSFGSSRDALCVNPASVYQKRPYSSEFYYFTLPYYKSISLYDIKAASNASCSDDDKCCSSVLQSWSLRACEGRYRFGGLCSGTAAVRCPPLRLIPYRRIASNSLTSAFSIGQLRPPFRPFCDLGYIKHAGIWLDYLIKFPHLVHLVHLVHLLCLPYLNTQHARPRSWCFSQYRLSCSFA
jgi:hypothetical protein